MAEGELPYMYCGQLENAVKAAKADALHYGKPAVILLSPACASWDQFKDFEERGNIFKALILN